MAGLTIYSAYPKHPLGAFMMTTTLFVPGFHGSGPDHWQTWMESQLPNTRRITAIDWESPVLDIWAEAIQWEIKRSPDPVWLVAHSFGCLATIAASVALEDHIAGALLVAPADPDRFTPLGARESEPVTTTTLAARLPKQELGFPSLLVASSDDPWMPSSKLASWQAAWNSHCVCIGQAGHINVESGFGPWPAGLELVRRLHSQGGWGPNSGGRSFSRLTDLHIAPQESMAV